MVSFGICSGTALFVSQFWGAKRYDDITKTYSVATTSAVFASMVFFVASFFFGKPIMSLFNSDPNVVKIGATYLKAAAFSYPATVLSSVLCTVLRSTEKVKLPMFVSLISTSLNIVLDYAFVFGKLGLPEMGVTGAAIATAISAWIGLFVLIVISRIQRNVLIIPIKSFVTFGKKDFMSFMKKASPVIFNEMLWGFGMVVNNAIYSNTGYENYAACTILRTIESLCLIMFIGLNDGGAVIIGKTVGEGKEKLAYTYAKKLCISVPVLSLLIGVVIIFVRSFVINIFNLSGNITPNTLSIANTIVIIYGLEIAIRNIPYTLVCAVFRSGGDSVTGAKYDLICLWALAIPVTYFTAFHLKLAFPLVFLIEYLVEDIPKAILCIRHFVSRKWIKSVVKTGN